VVRESEAEMRVFAVITAAVMILATLTGAASAVTKKKPVVERSAAGTVIQPTRTIIHNRDGTTTIIVTPRRSYLNPGTEVSRGDARSMDYALPPGGDPGRPYWWYGPDQSGGGYYIVQDPYYLPGINRHNPF
jgi:hypothetical protein